MAKKLANYVRSHRRRLGLSQTEVAFLVGAAGKAAVSLHESSDQGPSLETLIAYAALFGTSTKELYAGIHEKVEREMARRAGTLSEQLATARPTRRRAYKLERLRELQNSVAQSHQ